MNRDPQSRTPDHDHEWQPNGIAQADRVLRSPVTAGDDVLYTALFSVMVCKCGATRRVQVGKKNVRARADDWRKASRP